MKVLIEVQCYNRKTITDIVLKQLNDFKGIADLHVVNDHSTEYDSEWLKERADNVIEYDDKSTINILKYRSFKRFYESDYDYFYMCDNDAYHDPDFMNQLFKIYHQSNSLPVTLYRSSFIKKCGVYKITNKIPNGEIRHGLFGGISVFLDRTHIESIMKHLPLTEQEWAQQTSHTAWDSQIQVMASGKRFAIPDKSYVEHYGLGGQNHKTKNSDVALNPTPFLKQMYDTIWDLLEE